MAQVASPLRPLDLNKEPHTQQRKKKKEKLSSLCKTPPSLIRSKIGVGYQRGSCLGEGGFARCFQVKDDGGKIFAAKTVAKASLRSEKTKSKLLAEIKIHRGLSHPNVVKFVDCFEDDANVYILLEMCSNQSLMDMVRKRKRLTEPEARLLIVQIIGAVSYMHQRRVIHRDLKLGNIFLDSNMRCKIGDFGLATMLSDDLERKKTICGTPNYIAPEVLYGKERGHSYEVDIWSIGIILYAMLYGKPPFQSKDVDTIYERIKQNDYSFPEDSDISEQAQDLIASILQENPKLRPSLSEIIEHEFFKGQFPSQLNSLSLTKVPTYRNLDPEKSQENFLKAQIHSHLMAPEPMGPPSYAPPPPPPMAAAPAPAPAPKPSNPVEAAKAQVESDIKVLPHSLSPASTKDKYRMVMVKKDGLKDSKEPRASNSRFSRDLGPPIRREVKTNSAVYTKQCADALTQALAKEDSASAASAAPATSLKQALFVSKWVDYSNKYGLSYQLSDSQVGVLFRDKTTIIMDPTTNAYEGFRLTKNSISKMTEWVKKTVDPEDPSDHKRIKLIRSFYKYMQENLCKTDSSSLSSEGGVFVTQYNRDDAAVMFQLSNGSFQFNFPDHCKLIISRQGTQLDFIDPKRKINTWSLDSVVAQAKSRMSGSLASKFDILEKVSYCQAEIQKVWMNMVSGP